MSVNQKGIPGELISPSPKLLKALGNIGLHWWFWETATQRVTLSGRLIEILGLKPQKDGFLPEEVYQNAHPEDVVRNEQLLRRLILGEDSLYEIEYRIRDKEGKWQWYYSRGTVLQKSEDGKPLLINGITMEMSAPFARLLSMVEEKDKFEFIVRNTNEAIIVIELLEDRAGMVLDANKAAMDLFNKGPEAFGKPLPDKILQDEVIGKDGTLMRDVFEKGFGRVEQCYRTDDGRDLWLEFTLHSFTLTGENLMIAIVNDKTPERKSEAALRETERLYQTLFEAANDRIGLFSVEGKPLLMNSPYYEDLGYTREEYLGFGQYELFHPDDRERVEKEAEILLREGHSSHEYRIRHKDGHFLDMSSKLVLIQGQDGESDLVLFITRDITESNRNIKELEEAKERAVESDQLKSAFLANMSHEIRTPMNSIIGFSNLLNQSGLEEHSRELYVHRIITNSELLLTLITDIIDLAKIESGQLSIIHGRIRTPELIHDLEQYARDEIVRLKKERIEVVITSMQDDCDIEADLIRLTQVMKNLINNAIKFTDEGQVEIGCINGESDQSIRFYVKDSGIGISEEHFDLIFDQFRQVDGSNTRKFGGTGLGLAICKNLVHMMGGSIWVESKPGSGACFYVEHPRKASITEEKLSKEVKRVQERVFDGGQISILAVDDEPDTLELYQALLTQLGHRVTTAATGYEALRLLEQYPLPDLVLMDIQMPVMSGTDTLKIIKERYPQVKVVAQSAHALTGDRDRFLGEGYDDYLPKPFTGDQLEKVILGISE